MRIIRRIGSGPKRHQARTRSVSERTRTSPALRRFGNALNLRHARYVLRRFQVRDHKAKPPFAPATSDHLGEMAGNLLAFIFARTGNAVFTRHPHSLASRMGLGYLDDLFGP